ncbi:MAG: ABC transporter ATP-binding protein [Clostridiales bacterium]|nr:ABC transporter ATP-binding protein [Clostridiales bacterium]
MLTIHQLKKNYGNFQALNGLDLEIETGELFGFVGQNGAGKTTTMKILTGLLKADSGEIYFNEINVLKEREKFKELVGYVPDFFGVYNNLKSIEYMEFYASTFGFRGKEVRRHCLELIDLVGLSDKVDVYVDELSRGMQQRLCVARALVHNPKLLVLDEPASGLDPRSRYELKSILKRLSSEGITIMVSSHVLPEISEMCTSIGIIEKGKMVLRGSMEDILYAVNTSNPLIIKIWKEEEKAIEILKTNPFIKTISIEGKDLQLTFKGNVGDEAELLSKLVSEGVKLHYFGRKKDDLESIFMQITKESSKEGKINV